MYELFLPLLVLSTCPLTLHAWLNLVVVQVLNMPFTLLVVPVLFWLCSIACLLRLLSYLPSPTALSQVYVSYRAGAYGVL